MRHAMIACCVVLLLGTVPVAAQDAPAPGEAPRCGGLLCDLGVIGRRPPPAAPGSPEPAPDPTALPCNDFLCRAFGGHSADAAPPPSAADVAPAEATPAKAVKSKRKHKAKTAAATEAN